MRDTKDLQKKLFKEIEGRIKLEDESLKYKERRYEYWSKTTKEGNYTKYLRKKIGEDKAEMYWDGDKEAKGKKFFNAGDIEVSNNDEMLAYSIDDKGSEYFTINVRNISDGKIIGRTTSGNYSFNFKKNIAFGYVNSEQNLNWKDIEIEVEKIKYKAIIETKPLHDPDNKIIKN